MKQFTNFEKFAAFLMLIFAIGFNLWLYKLEPTAKIDPNDNAFQFALVDRTNQIWDFAAKNCPKNFTFLICHLSLLTDHWVPNWAEGYNLPFYYSHLPQIVIVASWRVIQLVAGSALSLFTYYHWLIYLLLSFFPLPVFLGLRIIGLPWLTAGLGAVLAGQLSTDGLYGLDPPSFLWRGYGLSSQLFAMIWLPLAISFSWKYLTRQAREAQRQTLWLAVLFLFLTTEGHLGIGIIALLSIGMIALGQILMLIINGVSLKDKAYLLEFLQILIFRFILLAGITLFFLSYWVIPTVLNNNYHNISVWDPVWKFNSYGAKSVITNLVNGDLFDFGRLPILTLLTILGFFAALMRGSGELGIFAVLFIFWLLMYFGRTTWGGLIDLIPGMKEFHLSRFLVGVHLAGLFLAPIGLTWLLEAVSRSHLVKKLRASAGLPHPMVRWLAYLVIGLLVIIPVYRQTINYNDLNNQLILRANASFDKVKPDVDTLFTTLKSLPPGRVFAGRGGGWGRDFRVAETPYYMHLSTFGIPTVLWLPETWSNNSDTEQFFSENLLRDYELYNIRYVLAPPESAPQSFWELIKETSSWKLYEVNSEGGESNYITAGLHVAAVSGDKQAFINLIHQWIQSPYPSEGFFPQIIYGLSSPERLSNVVDSNLPRFVMKDEVTYETPDQQSHNLLAEPPTYAPVDQTSATSFKGLSVNSQTNEADMIFTAKVTLKETCPQCLVILKQTYHPDWQATVDGQKVKPIDVFPSFVAVPVTQAGQHEIVFRYQPGFLKVFLLTLEFLTLIAMIIWAKRLPTPS